MIAGISLKSMTRSSIKVCCCIILGCVLSGLFSSAHADYGYYYFDIDSFFSGAGQSVLGDGIVPTSYSNTTLYHNDLYTNDSPLRIQNAYGELTPEVASLSQGIDSGESELTWTFSKPSGSYTRKWNQSSNLVLTFGAKAIKWWDMPDGKFYIRSSKTTWIPFSYSVNEYEDSIEKDSVSFYENTINVDELLASGGQYASTTIYVKLVLDIFESGSTYDAIHFDHFGLGTTCGDGLFNSGVEECEDDSWGSHCSLYCECDSGYGPDGSGGCEQLDMCGSADGQSYYSTAPQEPTSYAGWWDYCAAGSAVTPIRTGTSWSWNCPDENSCAATNSYCGDGTTQIGNGEECDGRTEGSDSCSASCQCPDGFEPDGAGNCVRTSECFVWTGGSADCTDGSGPAEIYFVIDESGSMNGTRISKVKEAIGNFIDGLVPGTDSGGTITNGAYVGIVSFDTNGNALVVPSSNNFTVVKNTVNAISPGGMTNIGEGLAIARSNLETGYTSNKQVVILLSDGSPNRGGGGMSPSAWALHQAQLLSDNGVELYSVAIDAAGSVDALFADLANPLDNFFDVNQPGVVDIVLQGILGEVACVTTPPTLQNICPSNCEALDVEWGRATNGNFEISSAVCNGVYDPAGGTPVFTVSIVGESGTEYTVTSEQYWTNELPGSSETISGANTVYASAGAGLTLPNSESSYTINCYVQDYTSQACTYEIAGGTCGDGYTDAGEQCDDGNDNNNDACTNECTNAVCGDGYVNLVGGEECDGQDGCDDITCQFIDPACTLAVVGTGHVGGSVTFNATFNNTGVIIGQMLYGDGEGGDVATTMYHAYDAPGVYNASFTVMNATLGSSLKTTCNAVVTVIENTCGNGYVDSGEECGEPGLSCGSGICNTATCGCEAICSIGEGTPTDFYISPMNYGDGYDDPVSSQVNHAYLYAGSYNAEFAVVNRGNPEEKSICQVVINVIPRTCGNSVQNPGEECGEPGLLCTGDDICNPYSCLCENSCEQVVNEIQEECDNGGICSDNPAQGCNYYDASVCGSPYATCTSAGVCTNNPNIFCSYVGMNNCGAGATCDAQEGDGCNQLCQLEYCGDGVRDIDGVNNIYGDADDEACDDGPYVVDMAAGTNAGVNGDTCTNRCQDPGCGDGTVDTSIGETCDRGSRCNDWNSATPTNCTLNPYVCPGGLSECKPRNWPDCGSACSLNSFCGDGNVDSPNSQSIVEQCDDGDNIATNACNNDCEESVCGDGIFQNPNTAGVAEECEYIGGQWVNSVGDPADCVQPAGWPGSPDANDSSACKLVNSEPAGQCQLSPRFSDNDLQISGQTLTNITTSSLCFNSTPVLPDLSYVNPNGLPEYTGAIPSNERYAVSDSGGSPVVVYDESIGTYRWSCEGSDSNLNATCRAWVCGDGITDGFVIDTAVGPVLNANRGETCDDGNRNNGDGCDEFCQLEEVVTAISAYSGSCIDNRTDQGAVGRLPVVQDDEYLPIWWELDDSAQVNWEATSCASADDAGVRGQTMKCTFGVYNKDGRVSERYGDCYRGIDSRPVVDTLNPTFNVTLGPIAGRDVMEDVLDDYGYANIPSTVQRERRENVMGLVFEDMSLHTNNIFGQYKIILEKIEYDYCAAVRNLNQDFTINATPDYTVQQIVTEGTYEPNGGVCEMRFGVTQGYFVQRGAGLSEESNEAPTNFTNYEGNELVVTSSPLDASENRVVDYSGAGKQYLTDGFIAYWEDIAVQPISMMNNLVSRTAYKVPNQRIYLIDESSLNRTIVIEEGSVAAMIGDVDTPFTLIVKGADVVFKGSVEGRGLYVVERDVIFDPYEGVSGCDDTEVIEGIFITNGEFQTKRIRNDDLGKSERCGGGNMIVRGLLIGAREPGFTQKRRSVLDAWNTDANLFVDDSQLSLGENQLKKFALFEYCYRPLLEHNFGVELCALAEGQGSTITAETSCEDGIDDGGISGYADCADVTCAGSSYCQNVPFAAGENWSIGQCSDYEAGVPLDNNNDGHANCSDYGCISAPACNPGIQPPENGSKCSDGIDNNFDGFIDCADHGCSSNTACMPGDLTETVCNDRYDNDLDGLVDCADGDCDGVGGCSFNEIGLCMDGIDNDSDGLVDCFDPDCEISSECTASISQPEGDSNPYTCFDAIDNDLDGNIDCGFAPGCITVCSQQTAGETTNALCSDGLDNDFDGRVDCADSQCVGIGTCFPEGTAPKCADGLDNDSDGRVDCFDEDCVNGGFCANSGEICNDNMDNNGDGFIDCADTQCQGISANCKTPQPVNEICNDNIDNDFDGKIDCADDNSICPNQRHCQYPTAVGEDTFNKCKDGIDNDQDALVDCADPDCSGKTVGCTQPSGDESGNACNDGIDNDGDYLIDLYDPDCNGGVCYYIQGNATDQPSSPHDGAGNVRTNIPGLNQCEPVSSPPTETWTPGEQPKPRVYPNDSSVYAGKLVQFNNLIDEMRLVFKDVPFGASWFWSQIDDPFNWNRAITVSDLVGKDLMPNTAQISWLGSATNDASAGASTEMIEARTNNIVQGASFVVELDPSIWTLNPPGADEFLQDMQVFK